MTTYHNAERAASYGVRETNPLGDEGHNWENFEDDAITLAELQARGGRISRLRFLTESGYPYMDVSYVQGVLPNGRNVSINIQGDCSRIRKGRGSEPYMSDLIAWAQDEGVFGKGIGMLDRGVWSILH
jgi:hypothetical protein